MQQGEHFITFLPEHQSLRGLVSYYYLHYSEHPDFSSSFVYYPHYRNAITSYLDADATFSDSQSHIRPGLNCPTVFSRNYNHCIQVQIEGPFRKMGIAFEPLGINHFLPLPLLQIAPHTVNAFSLFSPGLEHLMRRIYEAPKANHSGALDSFVMERMSGFHQPILAKAIERLLQNDGTAGVAEIADEFGISRKTLLRTFQKHLCCSVEEYKNLIKFRNALNDYRESEAGTTFTELAHKHLYYDQPAFIKHFKSITGLSPRAFFASLQRYGERDTYWTPKK